MKATADEMDVDTKPSLAKMRVAKRNARSLLYFCLGFRIYA